MKETLINLRTKNRYSQNALAKELGISRQAYNKYEIGEVEPSVEIIRKLSKIFKVSYKNLIDDELNDSIQNPSYIIGPFNEMICAESDPPFYEVSNKKDTSELMKQIQSGLDSLTKDQLSAVLTIIQSINRLNLSNDLSEKSEPKK